MTMQMIMWIFSRLQVTSNVVSQKNDLSNERWDQDPIVQDIARELGKFLKEYIQKYCKNSTHWMSIQKYDEHPVYVKSSMESAEPEEETLVLRRSFISRLPDKEFTGDRRAAAEGSAEKASSEDDTDGILLEIEDQPKETKSLLTPDELILSVNSPEGTRRSSISLPSDLQQVIRDYLRLRRKRRKRFKISVVENQQIHLSGGSNTDTVMLRRANEPVASYEYIEGDPTLDRRFIRISPNNNMKPKKIFSAGVRIGVLPGDTVDYPKSNPIHLQMGIKKVPGFSKFIPGMSIKQPSFPSDSMQFATKPLINKFEIKGQPSKPYGFKISTENKPYDMYHYGMGNKEPKDQYSLQQLPGEYIPGQANSPYGFSIQNKPYDIKGNQYEMPGSSGQMKSPSGSMEFSIGGLKKPYGPDSYNVQQYEIPGPIPFGIPEQNIPGPIQFGMPGQNIPGPIQFGIPGPIPFGAPGQNAPGFGIIPSNSFNLPDNKQSQVSHTVSPPALVFHRDPVYGTVQKPQNFDLEQPQLKFPELHPPGQIEYDFPGQSIPGQKFEIPGQKFEIPGQKFEIPGGYTPGQANAPDNNYQHEIPEQKYEIPGQKFEIPGQKLEIPGQKFEIPGGYTPGQSDAPSDSFILSIGHNPYDGKAPDNNYQYEIPGQKLEIPGEKFEFPGEYIPGQARAPSGSFKLSIRNKPYDSNVPDNNYQYQIPGQKLEIPGEKFEFPGEYIPGQASAPSGSFKLSIRNKPYDSNVPDNNYQYQIPGQKLEIPGEKFEFPGEYIPGQARAPSGSFKLSIGNKPYDSNVPDNNYQYQIPGLSINNARPPYGPDITYNVNRYELPGQMNMPQFDIKPGSSNFEYSSPGQDYGINLEQQPIGLRPQSVKVGYTQHTPSDMYYQESTPQVLISRQRYSMRPSYTDVFRRKMEDANNTSEEKPTAEPMQEGLREELLQNAMEHIAKEFNENMKKMQDHQQPAQIPEVSKEETEDKKNEQERTEKPQTVEPTRRGVNEIDTNTTMRTPQPDILSTMTQPTSIVVTLTEPVKNQTNSSEEGYVYGISAESSEEATLANTYADKSGEHDHRHKCDDTSEYEYDDESEEDTVKPDLPETRRANQDVSLQWALKKVHEMVDKDNTTQTEEDKEEEMLPHSMIEINMTEVRRFGDQPESFNGSIENFKPLNNSSEDLINSSEISDDNRPNQNEDAASNTGTVTFDIGKLFPPGNTFNDHGFRDNLTMIISDTVHYDNKETKPEVLPVKPNTEQADLKPTETYSGIEEPIQNITETPMQRMNTEVTQPAISQAENIDNNPGTSDLIPEDTVPDEVTVPVFIDDALPAQQTETPIYTEGVENPTEAQTEQVEYSTLSTLAPDMVEEYTDSGTTVTFTELPSITTVEITEAIEHDTDVTGPPHETITDMGKDIDYVQYYSTDDPGSEVTIEETTTASTNPEYTTLNLLDSPTTTEFTTLNYEDTTTGEAVTEENVLANTEAPQRRNKPSEDSVEDTETDPSFENGLPFLKHKMMTKDDDNYENYILEDILQKPFNALTDKEKVSFERMLNLSKHPDDVTLNSLPKNYRPLNSTDDQFLLRGLLNDGILDNDYLRKGVILLKNYPFGNDVELLKIRTVLKEFLRDFKNKPDATTNDENRMNIVLSELASHRQELDRVYEAMVKKRGEPDADELALIDQWLRQLNLNKGIELMHLYDNNGGGSEDEFRTYLIKNQMKKEPAALTEEEKSLLDILVLMYKNIFLNRPNKEKQDILEDDLYNLGIFTIHDSSNRDNPGLLSQELLEFVFKKPDTELNEREYKIYNYLMKLAKNPYELIKRYNEVMGTVKNDLDEKYVELNNGAKPTSFEVMSASLNDILPKKPPQELTQHDYYILYLLRYLADNKELVPHLANFEHHMIYNLPLFKYGIITTANSPNRNKKELLSDELLKTVLKKPLEQLNAKEKMIYKQLMDVPSNHAYLMDTYNFIINMLKDSVGENDDKNGRKNRYMVAIIKIPIKTHDDNGDVITNKTIKISMDDIHTEIRNLAGEPIDNEKAVFIMPEEDGESLRPLNLDDKTKLVHKLEVTRASMKVNSAHPTEYVEIIPQYLDDLIPDLVRLLQSDSTQAFNESGEINYDVNNNEPGNNLQQLLGHTILQIRRRKTNPTEVDDSELIEYLTTLQRNLMNEIKSEYGTIDFTQQPVKIERRYMDEPDTMEPNESNHDQNGELPSTGQTDATPVGQRRSVMDTPVQLAMKAVAQWFTAQNQMQQPNQYRRAGSGQYTTDYPQQQNFQGNRAVSTSQRRGMMDTPVQLAMKAVAQWFTAQNQMQQPNQYRKNVPDQYGYPQGQGNSPMSRTGLMDAPVNLAKNTVRKFADGPNLLQSLTSFRRTVPDDHTTDYPSEHASPQTIIEPARRYYDYYDSLEDYNYADDPVQYFRRSNMEHDGREEEREETTTEKVMPKADDNTVTENTPFITLKVRRNKGGPQRNNRRQLRKNVKHEDNDKVWQIKGYKRRSATSGGADKRELIPISRRAMVANEGNNIEAVTVGGKRQERKRRQRGRSPRRRRARSKLTPSELVRRFSQMLEMRRNGNEPSTVAPVTLPTEFVPTTPQADVQNATPVLVPSRRQFPLSIISGLMPFGGGGGMNPMGGGGGGGGFNPLAILGALNPLQMFGMRRNEDEISKKQTEPARVLGHDNKTPVLQAGQANYNGQPYNYKPKYQIQTYTDGNVPPDYGATPVPADGNVPPAGQNYDPQNNGQQQTPQSTIEPSQKNRRSADSISLLGLLNPVEFARRLNPFISSEQKSPVESTTNRKNEENKEEHGDNQTQRSEIEAKEKNSTDNVESSTRQESDATEHSLQTSTNVEEAVTSPYKPEENQVSNQTAQRHQIELEDEKDGIDDVGHSTMQANINTTTEESTGNAQEQQELENEKKQGNNNTTEGNPLEENISNVQQQNTTELVENSQQKQDSVMETTQYPDQTANSTTSTSQLSTENAETT